MAVVLFAVGLFLYLRLESQLDESLETALRSRATEVSTPTPDAQARRSDSDTDPLVEQDESFAQILTPDGRIVDSTTQLGDTVVLDPGQLQQAGHGATFLDGSG